MMMTLFYTSSKKKLSAHTRLPWSTFYVSAISFLFFLSTLTFFFYLNRSWARAGRWTWTASSLRGDRKKKKKRCGDAATSDDRPTDRKYNSNNRGPTSLSLSLVRSLGGCRTFSHRWNIIRTPSASRQLDTGLIAPPFQKTALCFKRPLHFIIIPSVFFYCIISSSFFVVEKYFEKRNGRFECYRCGRCGRAGPISARVRPTNVLDQLQSNQSNSVPNW